MEYDIEMNVKLRFPGIDTVMEIEIEYEMLFEEK